jgi:hypothetical protein
MMRYPRDNGVWDGNGQPFTYSIAYGLIAGIGTWVFMSGTFFALSLVGIEKPEFHDPDVVSSESMAVVERVNSSEEVE